MRIAQVVPIAERVPPKKYGGTERVVHDLTEELVKMGHEVTLFATGDSQTSAKLFSVYPVAMREARMRDLYGLNAWTLLHLGIAYSKQDEFDIIHDHLGYVSLPTANLAQKPVVMTLHGPFTPENRHIYRELDNPFFVTISKAQATIPGLHYAGNVYNGLNMDHYPFSEKHKGYLLYVGRISAEKGVHHAIEVAMELHLDLIIAAKLEKVDAPYFDEYIGPYLSEKIRWIGEVDEKERNKLMSEAMCFMHPVIFREPFGLTLIEAMACGCPAVAFNRGSIPEIIDHGKTGFVVNGVEEMIEAVEKIGTIKREDCRKHALENFNAHKMAEGYVAVYQKILNGEIT
jgi:glycosyltransferase involved in cell wall biosynthesis